MEGNLTRFRIWDHFRGYPERAVSSSLSQEDIDELARTGVLHWPGYLTEADARAYGATIDELADEELGRGGARRIEGNGYYVRDLLEKDRSFHRVVRDGGALGVARTLLGPQVQVRADSRIAYEGVADAGLPWHLHFPAVTDPLPPWFSYPHSLHGLIYLDDVSPDEGALVVLPGSFRDLYLRPESIDESAAISLLPRRGDCVLLHGNTWHRTERSRPTARRRRILFLGFTAAWVQGDTGAGGQPTQLLRPRVDLADSWDGDPAELDELVGRFRW